VRFTPTPGQGIQVGGLVSNVSREVRLLGLPALNPEKLVNLTVGLGLNPTKNLSVTLDFYNIVVKDRLILSTEIGSTAAGNTALDKILAENNISDLSFFVNALDTRTSGIDFVSSYRNVVVGKGKLNINLSGNYTIQNEREGEVKNLKLVADAGQSVANATQEALFFTSRPLFKAILGFDYQLDKLGMSLNNTLFGPTKFKQQGLSNDLYTEFETKVVTDSGFNYSLSEKNTLALNINNLLNILPQWNFKAENAAGEALLNNAAELKNQLNLITFNQRYSRMTYDGYHFSQLGTMVNLSLNVRF
jgi:iron complex outermembrane receptor protein